MYEIVAGLAWLFQIGITLLIAAVIAYAIYYVRYVRKGDKSKRHFLRTFFAVSAIICLCIAYLTNHPIVYCYPEYREQFTPELRERVVEVSAGLYSNRIPAFPVVAQVQSIKSGNMVVEIYYAYIGSALMDISLTDQGLIKGVFS